MAMDELLRSLNSDPARGGTLDPVDNIKIRCIAFADDVLLLEDNEAHLTSTLHQAAQFFKKRGMSINFDKTTLLTGDLVPREGKIINRTKPFLVYEGHTIRQVTGNNPFKYLGHRFGTQGISKPSLPNLTTWLERVGKAPLKPCQKLGLVKNFIIPRLLYGLQNPKVMGKTLREADRAIKFTVKRFLHLSGRTPDAALYAKLRDGGMGLAELRSSVPRILLKRLTKMLDTTSDPTTSWIMQSDYMRKIFIKVSALAGTTPPDQVWREKLVSCPFLSGLEATSESAASRGWIDRCPAGWSGRDYVRAVQLRTNNLPTVGLVYNNPEQKRCRAGCNKVETICHVLQSCPATHWPRIKRHNEIAKKIARHARTKNLEVEEEPHIRSAEGTLFKPDLIIHTPNNITVVCDVQVSWEGSRPLAESHENKRAVYGANQQFIRAAQQRWPGRRLLFEPLTIGARGIWPRCNDGISEAIKIHKGLMESCVHSALKWASTIHAAHGRQVWR